ncbi:MAG: hypothetical protein ACXVK4_13750 [Acidimicrobiia bacterium]
MRYPIPTAARHAGRVAAGAAAALVLTACPGPGPSPDPPPSTTTTMPATGVTTFHDDFDAGAFAPQWRVTGASVETAPGEDPAAWAHLAATGDPTYLSLPPRVLESGHAVATLRGRFRVTARPAGRTVGLATIENTNGHDHADLFVDASTGRCRVDVFRDDTAKSPGRCDDGAWHVVTMSVDDSSDTFVLRWTLDGTAMPDVRSTGEVPATVRRLLLGDPTTGKSDTSDWTAVDFALG